MKVMDLTGKGLNNKTSEHYSEQWSAERGMGQFMLDTPAKEHTMQFVLGWRELFDHIRAAAVTSKISVYDAACGYGGIMHALFEGGQSTGLRYVGADIRDRLDDIPLPADARPEQIQLVRFDISERLPLDEKFDFVVCRNAIHHTPDPRRTFASLCKSLKCGGTIAISAYSKKARMREAMDDALRAVLVPMNNEEALAAVSDLTELGRALREVTQEVNIGHDLTFLRVPAGTYAVQELIYNHVVKCWYNEKFGPDRSHIVNFDWYHAPYAYRYELDELTDWFEGEGLVVTKTDTHPSQHYVEGQS
jgi:SAM-dependent methyltransferase